MKSRHVAILMLLQRSGTIAKKGKVDIENPDNKLIIILFNKANISIAFLLSRNIIESKCDGISRKIIRTVQYISR